MTISSNDQRIMKHIHPWCLRRTLKEHQDYEGASVPQITCEETSKFGSLLYLKGIANSRLICLNLQQSSSLTIERYACHVKACSHVTVNDRMRIFDEAGHFWGMIIQQVSEKQHRIDTSNTIALPRFGQDFCCNVQEYVHMHILVVKRTYSHCRA